MAHEFVKVKTAGEYIRYSSKYGALQRRKRENVAVVDVRQQLAVGYSAQYLGKNSDTRVTIVARYRRNYLRLGSIN